MSEMVPEGWEVCNFGKYAKVRNGFAFKSSDFKEKGNGSFPIIRMSNLKKGTLDLSDAVYVDESVVSGLEPFALKPNDFVFGMSGSITNYGVVKKSNGICYQNQRVGRLQSLGSNQTYLSYLFTSDLITRKIELMAAGAAQVNISSTQIEELEVPFPPLPEQKKIASILTSVDEVIEKTQSQIDKLQDLKKATMNELLTKGIGHTEFKDSALGRIPKSWEVKRLDEVSNISRGKFSHRPRNDPEFYDGNHPYLQTGDIPNDVNDITSFTQTLNDKGLGVSKIFKKGTLVLTIAATIGEVGILTFDSCFPDSLVGINCKREKIIPYFLLYSLRFAKQKLISEAPESAQKNLNLDILNPFLINVPELNEQKEIETIFLSIDHNLIKKTHKLHQTQSLKKSLMQDLLTGKVRVMVN